MMTNVERLEQRNREIGQILFHARREQQRSVTECAALLATSRRRYNAIERGKVPVSVAELELLMNYLQVPIHVIWKDAAKDSSARHVVIQAHPGETVQLTLTVQSE
jgi:transcriptional regulator with XRE-family HTH domain